MDFLIIVIFLGILIVPFIFLLRKCFKQIEKNNNNKRIYNATIRSYCKHVEGLPVPNGAYVDILYGNEKITFLKDNQEISILTSKVVSIDIVDGNSLKAQVAAGAIAGKYIIGGTAGALIGVALSSRNHLVITYKNDDEYKFIIFDTETDINVYKIEKDFKQNNNEQHKIEL